MEENGIDLTIDLAGLRPEGWRAALDGLGEAAGSYTPLGPDHAALFIDAGKRLLVTFENAQAIRATLAKAQPRGLGFAAQEGWSVLTLLCEGDTWFRDSHVHRYVDRLVDDGFFEDFDRVVFYGDGPCGYAAAAHSVAAPGATLIALRPQATLAPEIAGWDRRYIAHRRRPFRDRYGYAPDMVEAAARAFLIFDPFEPLDAMHAALFRQPHVTFLRCAFAGERIETLLHETDALNRMIALAMEDQLDSLQFARLIRRRHVDPRYLRMLVMRLEHANHPRLASAVCLHAIRHTNRPFFAQRLALLGESGPLPDLVEESRV